MGYWNRLLAHNHWLTLRAFGKELRLCARCSGVVLGAIMLRILTILLISPMNYSIPLQIGVPVSLALALPSIVDWSTQNLGFRQSNNTLRVITGVFEGVGVMFLSIVEASVLSRFTIICLTGISVVGLNAWGRRLLQMVQKDSLIMHS